MSIKIIQIESDSSKRMKITENIAQILSKYDMITLIWYTDIILQAKTKLQLDAKMMANRIKKCHRLSVWDNLMWILQAKS